MKTLVQGMTFVCLLAAVAGGVSAGQFNIIPTSIAYPPTLSDTSLLYRVEASARYEGTVDSDDQHALIQTTAIDSHNGRNDGAGAGSNYPGRFVTGQVIACKEGCPGRRYLSRRICGHSQVEYWGEAGVEIYHQFSPDIDVKLGPRGSLVPCIPVPEPGCAFDPRSRQLLMEFAGRTAWEPAEDWAPVELATQEEREGFRYLIEEWALYRVAGSAGREPGVELLAASSRSYGETRREDLLESVARADRRVGLEADGWVLLLVDAPNHLLNGRHIPPPALRWAGGSGAWGLTDAGIRRVLVRADFGEDRSLWTFDVLYADKPLTPQEERRLETGLALEYFTERSHRVTAYATLSLGPEGVVVERGFSVPSQCCCALPTGCDPDFPEIAAGAAHH